MFHHNFNHTLAAFDQRAAAYVRALVILAQAGEEPWHEQDQSFAEALDQADTPDAVRAVLRRWFAWRTGSPIPAGAELH
ncbi:MAG: hypothetical protein ACFCUT_02380 [Kiloniellaceae bacterium]